MNIHSIKKFNVDNISDFLEIWLTQNLLSGEEKRSFDNYYKSYKKLFGKYTKFHYSQQTKELMETLSNFHRPLCLEIGCGCGTESLWIAYRGGAIVKGIDIKEERLSVARKRKEILEETINMSLPCSFEKRSLFELDEKNKFDIIWMEQTLHHLEPRSLAFDKISELIKEGGYVIISEANAWDPFLQVKLLLHRGFSTINEFVDESGFKHMYGDERILTPYRICKELEKRHIVKRSVRYFRVLPNISWSPSLLKLEKKLPRWLIPIYTHYNYVGEFKR